MQLPGLLQVMEAMLYIINGAETEEDLAYYAPDVLLIQSYVAGSTSEAVAYAFERNMFNNPESYRHFVPPNYPSPRRLYNPDGPRDEPLSRRLANLTINLPSEPSAIASLTPVWVDSDVPPPNRESFFRSKRHLAEPDDEGQPELDRTQNEHQHQYQQRDLRQTRQGGGGGGSGGGGTQAVEKCHICMRKIKGGRAENKGVCMPCSHPFHFECLRPWLLNHTNCPYCRQQIPYSRDGVPR